MSRVLDLNTFANGALAEKLDMEFEKVAENILDPNTEWKKPRKIVATITIHPNQERNLAQFTIDTKSVLAPMESVETTIMFGKDMRSGKVVTSEWKNQIPGQTEIEVEEEKTEQTANNILDLRKQAK